MKRGGDMKMDLEVKLDWTGGVARRKPRLRSVELEIDLGGGVWS